jgi:eukaryotic-like serine/threonine-protein kinase
MASGSLRRRQIEELHHAALTCGAADRAALLARADPDVRREVELLLAQKAGGVALSGSVTEPPALVSLDENRVRAGTQFGPYRVESVLGAGGMGRVYRALDTRLNRSVAFKIVCDEFGERFAREARAIARLNHPHICTLYDVGPNYLVMELVDGETVATRLTRGRLPLDQTLRYAVQMADALATAHAKGIVHRDLKPGNVMLTKAGVKVLDFGLAKSEADDSLTRTHAVLGTPAYMAPEQREGHEADARSDIYALGLVLQEMATGKRSGELQDLPPPFVHVVKRCLEPDPADRWQAASDVKKELEWVAVSPATAAGPRSSSSRLAWGVAALAFVGMLSTGLLYLTRQTVATLEPTRFTLAFDKEIDGYDLSTLPVPSPTGQFLAFAGVGPNGGTSLWIRSLQSIESRRLPGTDGAGRIAWSPDGNWIAFFADGKLKKVSPHGGPPQTIAAVPGFQEAAWGPDGDIIFRPTNRAPLFRIRDSGGSPEPLTTLNASLTENSHRFPEFLPGGRLFFFVGRCAERANNALYIGSLDTPEVTRVMPAQSRVSYVPAGAGRPELLVFFRDGALLAQRFHLEGRDLISDAVPLLERVGYNAPSIEARFRVSADGRVVVIQGVDSISTRFRWFDRSGEELGVLGEPAENSQPRISPQGDRVLYSRPDPQTGNRDVWYVDIGRGTTARLTNHVANDWHAVWSPDGRQLVFGSDRDGGPEVMPYLKTSMDPGSNESRHLRQVVGGVNAQARRQGFPSLVPHDWAANGWMAYEGAGDVFVGPASAAREPFRFLTTETTFEGLPRFSPDGKWIAYTSNESGRAEVYVRPFSGAPAEPSGKLQVSNNGGEYAVWGPSGREIFYMSVDGTAFAVNTRDLGRTETLPTPVRLFRTCASFETIPGPAFLDTRDGQRFLVACRMEPPGRFTVLTNWTVP